jgi:hypothetical protein
VFAAKHLLDFAGVHLARKRLQPVTELGECASVPLLSPFDEHRQIITPAAQRRDELAVVLEPPPALKQLLRFFLVFPEIRLRDPRFDSIQLVFRFGRFKDSSEDRPPV